MLMTNRLTECFVVDAYRKLVRTLTCENKSMKSGEICSTYKFI
jgi:hypothetical protein